MGLVHIPRTILAVARGAARGGFPSHLKHQNSANLLRVGLTPSNPHIYTSRVGMLDVDIVGHMNNAAYLHHAELAKWQMTAESGLLFPMMKQNCAYIVSSSAIRYRRELPFLCKFQVHTHIPAIDDRHIWMYHTFRYASNVKERKNKVRAQLLIKAVLWVDRQVLDPRVFLQKKCEVDPEMIRHLDRSGRRSVSMEYEMDRFDAMEEALRSSAARDDESIYGEPHG